MTDVLRFTAALAALLALGLAGAAPAGAQNAEVGPTLFRHADLGRLGRIELRAPFAQRGALGVPIGGGAYHVRGWYTGTDGITVYTDPAGVVTAMRFEYDLNEGLEAKVASYTEALGSAPARERHGRFERAMWEDGATRFEIVRVTGPKGEMYALLSDLGGSPPASQQGL